MSKEAINDENGNAVNCKTILESLLQMFNCRIFQQNGQWTIISLDALALSTFNGTGKNFITYNTTGGSENTFSIVDPVKSINSTEDADTLQPMNNDLIKIIKRPCVRNKTHVRVKDMNRNEFDNGGFESVGSKGASPAPTWGFIPTDWTGVSGASSASDNAAGEYVVNSTSVNTGTAVTYYPPTFYGGSYAMLSVGISSSVPASPMFTNATGNTENLLNPSGSQIKFSFAALADDPDNSGLLAYTIRWRLKIASYYWDEANARWTSDSTVNSTIGAIQDQWQSYNYETTLPDNLSDSTITIDFYKSNEAANQNASFRMYFDDVKLTVASEQEFYSTTVQVTKATIKNNSGVIPAFENRFGEIGDNAYINCLVDSNLDAITHFTDFDLSGNWTLEVLMGLKRLNDLATNNDRFEGTVRKIKSSDGFLDPIDMLTLPQLDFTTVQSINNRLAIDRLSLDVKKNRYKLITHTPAQSELTTTSNVSQNTSFYEFKPED